MAKPTIPTSAKKLTDRVRKLRKTFEAEKVKIPLPLAQKAASILFGVPHYDLLAAFVDSDKNTANAKTEKTPPPNDGLTKAQRTLCFAANKILHDVTTNYDMGDLADIDARDAAIMEYLIPFMDKKAAEEDYIFFVEVIAAKPFDRADLDHGFSGHKNCISEVAGMAGGILKDTIRDSIKGWLSGEHNEAGDIVDAKFEGVVELMENGDEEGAIEKYLQCPDLIFSTDDDGWTLLTYAASLNLVKVTKCLIDTGCPIDHQDEEGWTALNEGAQQGSYESVKLLLEAGANPNISTMMGWQPYGTAASFGHQKIADLLEEFGAKPIAGNAGLEGVDLESFMKNFVKKED